MIRVRELGWFYVPASILAWLVVLAMIAFSVQVFLAIDARSHSATDTLYGVFPYWAVTFLLWNWMGSRARRN
jgi:hypothetical protein